MDKDSMTRKDVHYIHINPEIKRKKTTGFSKPSQKTGMDYSRWWKKEREGER